MRLELPRHTLKDDLRTLPLRRLAGIVTLLLACAVLAFRIEHLQRRSRVEWSARTARFALVKHYSDRVLAYAEQYGRPVFAWTGVHHVSAAESTLYENLRVDLLDPRVRYWYDDSGYYVAWRDPYARRSDPNRIVVSNPWPPDAAFYAHVRWVVNHPAPPHVRRSLASGQPIRQR